MIISEFKSKNIRITWTLLLICFDSNNVLKNTEYNRKFISGQEIIDYAIDFLNCTENPNIISLAILNENEDKEIYNYLKQLSKCENCDYQLEFRKFRVMYIYKNMPSIKSDFMHGILDIIELWSKFDFPKDAPNIYIKFEDFSYKNFLILLNVNKDWVYKELESINCIDIHN